MSFLFKNAIFLALSLFSASSCFAYDFSFVPCPEVPASNTDIESVRSRIADAFRIFGARFPVPEEVVIEAGFVCNGEFTAGMARHWTASLSSEDKIVLSFIHPSQKESARKQLQEHIVRDEKAEGAEYSEAVRSYVEWKLGDAWPTEALFHELLHVLNDRSELPHLFVPLIDPSFDRVEETYRSEAVKVKESFRPELERRLRALGLGEATLKGMGLSSASGSFFHPECRSSALSPLMVNACAAINAYNVEIADKRNAAVWSVGRRMMVDFRLPFRHAFDLHVFNPSKPNKAVFEEEFITISGEVAFFDVPAGIFSQLKGDSKVERLRRFWRETDFKELLSLTPSKRAYYSDLDRLNAHMDAWIQSFPSRVEGFEVGRSVNGQAIRGVRIRSSDSYPSRRVLIDAGHHSDEALAVKALEQWISSVLTSHAYPDTEFVVVPVLNVDGYRVVFGENGHHRLNGRKTSLPGHSEPELTTNQPWGAFGVDLNRNYPSSRWLESAGKTYRGPFPFSEPESKAIDRLLSTERFDLYLSLHSAGNSVVCPKGTRGPDEGNAATRWCWALESKLVGSGYTFREASDYGQSTEYAALSKGIPSALIEIGALIEKDQNHAPNVPFAQPEIARFERVIKRILD